MKLQFYDFSKKATKEQLWLLLVSRSKAAVLFLLFILSFSINTDAQTAPTDDFDGDGIINSIDIDDDNDGIPDKLENQCPTLANWTDWTSVTANSSATGTLATSSGNVTVTYTSAQVYSIQSPGYFNLGDASGGTMSNTGVEGLQALHGVNLTHTYTFSQPVKDPILVFWSMNGNTFTFTSPFTILGQQNGVTRSANTLIGVAAECNATIQLHGTFSSISYTSTILENWTGVTVGVQNCTNNLDTDGDGIVNSFDLDSDGDGCSDAYEAGATTDKTANFKFTGAVGTNGLVNSSETTADYGVVNYSSTYTNYALSNGLVLCVDSDNDGVGDIVDIDDDNDGIPDKVENQCPTFATWTDWTAVTANNSATGTLPLSSGNVTVTYTSPQVYTIQQPGYFNIGDVYAGTMPASGTEGLQALHGAGTTHTYTFSQPVTNPILVFWSMNGNTFTFTRNFNILGQTAGISSSLTTLTGSSGVECNASIQFIGTFTSITYTSSLLENWTGVTVGTNYCPDLNTDGGAVVNRLQLDSDGDGCSDAYEGGATTNKTANFKFTGAVGTNGLDNSLETVADNGTVNYRDSYSSFAINATKNKCSLPSPGGVITGLGWWYEGDAGVTTSGTAVTKWNDQSPSALDVTQTTASRQPTNVKYQNFNKVMTFDGSDALNNATGFWRSSTNNTAYNVFAVTNHVNGTGSVNALFTENTNLGLHTLFNDYGGNAYNGIWASNYAYTPFASFSAVPQLLTSRYNNVGTVKQLSFNAKTQTMVSGGAAAAFNGNNSNLVIGNYIDQGSWPLNGDIAEIAMYASDLTATQRQQVESYLAIKWGVTLDQTTAYNYLNSSGGIVWNATTNSGYKNNIIGIGRDDAAGLNQKQSQSVIKGYQPVIGLGTGITANNAANTNSFTADKSFDIIGDNGAPATFTVAYAPSTFSPVAQYYRMNRIWTVQEMGTVGTVTIRVPAGADRLLVSSTAAFTPGSGTQEIALTSDGAGNVTAQVDFTTGQFFTFGRLATGPGGVVTTTYTCNLVQNGSFVAGALAGWTNTANWFDNGAYAHINADNVTNSTLKQTLSNLNATTTPNQVQVTFDVYALNIGVPSTLEIWLGGTKYAAYVINNGTSIVGTASNSATLSVTSLTNNVWSRGVLLTIPWVSKPNTGDLEFRFTSGNSDFGIDAVSITSNNCSGTLGWWYEGDKGIATSGTAVTEWADQSLSSLDVTQATVAKQPISTKLQNFNPVVTFTGNKALNNAAGYWKSSILNAQYNVFAVAKHTTGTGSVNSLFTENTSQAQQSLFMEYGGNMYMGLWGTYSAYTPFTTAVSNVPLLVGSRYNTTGNVKQLSWNGKAQTMTGYNNGTNTATFNGNNSNLVIGNHTDQGSWPFDGDIAEIFMYPFDLSATQRQQVESYLAIKWGLTLDQTTAYNYLNSSGATIWDATANSGFKNDITGIGVDAAADLNQKQSRTVNSSAYVTLAIGTSVAATNAANTANFGADKSFDIIGDNGLPARFANAYTPAFATNGLFYYSMSRIWKVQETGTVSTVTLSIPFRNNNTYLLVKNSATFGSGATEILMVKDGKGNLTATVDLTDGQFFTFASAQTAPGSVVSGLATWLKADAGVIDGGGIPVDGAGVDTWNDQSFTSTGYSVSQTTVSKQPLYYGQDATKLVNFNPSVYFDGASHVMTNSTSLFAGTSPFSFMMVGVDESTTTGYRKIFGAESPVDYFGLYKVSGATTNNGWSQYTVGNNYLKGTGYAPTGGASGYWNGTAYVADPKMQRIQPQIVGINSANPANTNPSTMKTFIDGYQSTETFAGTTAYQNNFFKSLSIGGEPTVEFWKGRIPEFVAYSRQLSDAETQKVNTYMAIKYGVTLGQGGSLAAIGNNAANYDYIATDGTKIWDATANTTYKSDITGIGRDDAEALDQAQSISMNASAYVTMALGNEIAVSNAANANSFTADKSYEIFGDNGFATTYANAYAPSTFTPTSTFYLMQRIWKVQETGTVGTVTVSVPAGILGAERLIVSNSAAFTPGVNTREIELSSDGNGNLTAQVDFNNGDFFTFGKTLVAPGGVVSNLNMWLKADALTGTDGSKVSTWSDSYLSTYSVDQATTTAQPTLFTSTPTNLVNFNPSVKFDNSAAQIMKNTTASPLTSTGISFHFIAVGKDQEPYNLGSPNYGSNRIRALLGNGASGDNPAMDLQKDGVAPNGWNPWSSLVGEYSGGKATMYNGGGVGNASGTGTMVLPTANVSRLINQQPQIFGLGYTAGTTTKINGWVDGWTEVTNLTDNNAAYTGGNYFGLGHSGGGEYWNGTINEVLAYGRELTANEMQRVNTYLAIKYGTTLGQGNGNVGLNTGYNYLATDGTTVLWNTTTNTGYNYDIAVIGQDNAEGLNQKQSKSVNAGIQPTIALGSIAVSNQANTNTFGADKTFEAWGGNGLGAGYNTNYTPTSFTPQEVFKRMDRAWKIQETGTVGAVTVKINSNADYMLVDTDGDGNFATGTIAEVLLTNKQATYNFNNGDVFTFGRDVTIQTCDNGLAFIHGDDAAGSSNASTLGLSAWKSNGNGTFSTTKIAQSGFNRDNTGSEVFGSDASSATYAADVDNDGDKDIVHVTENNSNSIYVYLNNADGTFQTTPVVTTGIQSNTDGSIFAGDSGAEQGWMGDANDDGFVDYIQSGNDKKVHVYLGIGNGTFATTRITSTLINLDGYQTSGISGSESFLAADVNNDGSVDLIGAYDPGHLIVWLGNGDGTFQATPYFDADIQDSGSSNSSGSSGSEYSQFADVDGDGDLDYVHAEGFDGTPQIWAFLNKGDGTFATTAVLTQASSYPKNTVGEFANYTGAALSMFNDVNNDGKADYVVTVDNGTAAQNGIYVYLATSNGSFAVTPIFTNIATQFATGTNSTETSFIACGFIICNAGVKKPALSATTKANVCPATTANLSTITASNQPVGTQLTWHTATPATLANKIADPTAVATGTYYAVIYDAVNNCFSGNGDSTTAVTVTITTCCNAGSTTPTLSATTATNTCPATKVNLGSITASNLPAGTRLTWHTATPATLANKVVDSSQIATAGTYYAAFYDFANACIGNGGNSTVAVTVTLKLCTTTPSVSTPLAGGTSTGNAATELNPTGGTAPYSYSNGSSDAGCTSPGGGAQPLPASSNLTVNSSTGAYSYTTPTTVGTYYFCIKVCDNTSPTPICKTVTYTVNVACGSGTTAPVLTTTTTANICPTTKVNLGVITASNLPAGARLTWHTATPATLANKVADSSQIATAGTYYAAFYDFANGCFGNGGASTTAVTVTINACAATFAFDCGTSSVNGTFAANAVAGQTGTVTIPMTGATAGTATFAVIGTGFIGTLSTTLTAGQASVTVPITYNGLGLAGSRALTITSTEGSGSCSATATISANIASFTFNCGTAAATGTFTANGTAGQTGSVTIPLTGATAGDASFTITGTGFTGSLSTTLTAGQTSVSVPITYDGTGMGGARTLTISSAQGTGSCSVSVTVIGIPDITTTIGQPSPALVVGQPSDLPITVKNIGTGPAPGVITTTITLPTGTSAPAIFTSNGSTCSTSGQTVTCTNAGPIAAGDSIKILVPVTPNGSIVGTNPIFNATTSPVTGETNTGNNAATPTTATAAVVTATVKVSAKVFLSGSYVTLAGMMHDSLRVKGLIPSAQPYSSMGYTGTETVAPSVLATTGANAIVDWVLVELRSDATTVVTKRAGLVQRDGDIVDVDGVTPLALTAASGSYYVVVKHRNHLGVMSGSAIALTSTTTTVDFTSLLTTNYQLTGALGNIYAQRPMGSVRALWSGNAGGGMTIKANGASSDGEAVLFKVLLDAGNASVTSSYIIYNTYTREDANMDGKVIYQGTGSEVDIILFNVLLHLGNFNVIPTFIINEQVP